MIIHLKNVLWHFYLILVKNFIKKFVNSGRESSLEKHRREFSFIGISGRNFEESLHKDKFRREISKDKFS